MDGSREPEKAHWSEPATRLLLGAVGVALVVVALILWWGTPTVARNGEAHRSETTTVVVFTVGMLFLLIAAFFSRIKAITLPGDVGLELTPQETTVVVKAAHQCAMSNGLPVEAHASAVSLALSHARATKATRRGHTSHNELTAAAREAVDEAVAVRRAGSETGAKSGPPPPPPTAGGGQDQYPAT